MSSVSKERCNSKWLCEVPESKRVAVDVEGYMFFLGQQTSMVVTA